MGMGCEKTALNLAGADLFFFCGGVLASVCSISQA